MQVKNLTPKFPVGSNEIEKGLQENCNPFFYLSLDED